MPGRAFSYLLVNENNIRVLVRELVNYLLVADTEFKQDLTAKICIVVQKFAPSKQWHVDTIIKVRDACARGPLLSAHDRPCRPPLGPVADALGHVRLLPPAEAHARHGMAFRS